MHTQAHEAIHKSRICLPASISNLLKACNTKCNLILLSNIFELAVDLMIYLGLEKVEYMLMKSIRVEERESDVSVRENGGIKQVGQGNEPC